MSIRHHQWLERSPVLVELAVSAERVQLTMLAVQSM
jgi:hypothetical protein